MESPSRVIISGGGTGGHIFPAIAIANALRKLEPKCEILFVGASGRMEMEKVPLAGYKIVGLNISGLQRSLSIQNLSFPFKVIGSLLEARRIVKEFEPDVAVGVGGYASGPLLFAASLMGVPTLIQEQNSFAGITNKILGKRASKICVAYSNMERFFPFDKIKLTGNPVRQDILVLTGKKELGLERFGLVSNMPILLVIGGSLGARTINEAMFAGVERLEKAGIQVIWQTGKAYFEKAKTKASRSTRVFDFLKEMDLCYAIADMVVSRAGASSISELCIVGKPVILVPSPNVAEDHQTHNALSLTKQNAAIMVKDFDAKDKLIQAVLALTNDMKERHLLVENIKKLGLPNSASEIAKEIFALKV